MLCSQKIVAFIQITDVDRARKFYEDVLGLRFVKDDGFAAVFDANGIMVRAAKMKEFIPLQSTVLGWEVGNIEEMVRGLHNKGVNFEIFGFFKQDELGIWTAPTGDKVAWFKDPDGNVLSVSQHV
jgi:catechol 2,3-dioxygenase-like lactoylglutathione lyase family enzyme